MKDLLQKTQDLCRQHGIIPARSKGQNFLIREDFYDKIIESSDLDQDDSVLEVGPGLGFLTKKLAHLARKVIAVELDDKLARLLKFYLKKEKIENAEVVNENVLDFYNFIPLIKGDKGDFSYNKNSTPPAPPCHGSKFKIVANLPYNITSVFLRKFLSSECKPKLMVLMLQKEVTERIVAKPGEMSLLAVSVQFYAEAKIIDYVPANAFWPKPAVDSAIIRLQIPNSELQISKLVDKERDFFRMVKFGFSAKRKMLKNNLSGGYHVSAEIAKNWLILAGFDPMIRAQNLSVNDWIKLFAIIEEKML